MSCSGIFEIIIASLLLESFWITFYFMITCTVLEIRELILSGVNLILSERKYKFDLWDFLFFLTRVCVIYNSKRSAGWMQHVCWRSLFKNTTVIINSKLASFSIHTTIWSVGSLRNIPPPFGDFWLRCKGGGIFLRGQKCPFRPTPHHAFEGPIFLRGQKCPSLLHDFFAPAARFYP